MEILQLFQCKINSERTLLHKRPPGSMKIYK
jgi:hypothetical protein